MFQYKMSLFNLKKILNLSYGKLIKLKKEFTSSNNLDKFYPILSLSSLRVIC